jgi:two-component system sensor histidine kinase KdpD
VGNLLDMTRLESGALKLHLQSGDVQDVVGAALGHLSDPQIRGAKRDSLIRSAPREPLRQHLVKTNDLAGLPPVRMDFVLIEQVLVNLLENAIKYSPPGSPIEIEGCLEGSQVKISVLDHGMGIPPEDLEKIFEKFYRSPHQNRPGGTGLGLSICKGIVEAHGGRIQAKNRPGGGAILEFSLPVEANTA